MHRSTPPFCLCKDKANNKIINQCMMSNEYVNFTVHSMKSNLKQPSCKNNGKRM